MTVSRAKRETCVRCGHRENALLMFRHPTGWHYCRNLEACGKRYARQIKKRIA